MAYRLIWFQHFHKAAGSSIVDAARDNGEVLYGREINGNPLSADGEQIPIWSFDASELESFIDGCQNRGVTFIACEWGIPDTKYLRADPRVVLITCLREPLARFVSNFYYDLHHGFTPARSLDEYIGARQRAFTMDNYYCRLLSGHDNKLLPVTEKEFLLAKQRLGDFDLCINLADGFDALAKQLGWAALSQHSNSGEKQTRVMLSRLLRFEWQLLYLQLRYRRRQPSAAFAKRFAVDNKWDLELLSTLN